MDLKGVVTLGSTALPLLALAVHCNSVECVKFLVEYVVDVNEEFKLPTGAAEAGEAPRMLGHAALELALAQDHAQITGILLAAGAKSSNGNYSAQLAKLEGQA